jgi:hypothetical protein
MLQKKLFIVDESIMYETYSQNIYGVILMKQAFSWHFHHILHWFQVRVTLHLLIDSITTMDFINAIKFA